MTTIKNFIINPNFDLSSIFGDLDDFGIGGKTNPPIWFNSEPEIKAVKNFFDEDFTEDDAYLLGIDFRQGRLPEDSLITVISNNSGDSVESISIGDHIIADQSFICSDKISLNRFINMISQFGDNSLKDVDFINIYQPVGCNWLVSTYSNIRHSDNVNDDLGACEI